MYYPDELIEEIRTRNDIVDVISGYVRLQKRAVHILDSALFIMRNHPLFLSADRSRCITASAAVRVEMCIHF